MKKEPIKFKGSNFTFSVLYLQHDQISIIKNALLKKIKESPKFLKNASIVLNISALSNKVNWKEIKKVIDSIGLHIAGVVGCNDQNLKNIVIDSGLPILSEGRYNKNLKIKSNITPFHDNISNFSENSIFRTKIINTPIRSGQKVYSRNTDLIITNIVSPGAELVADGNVHIYGIMRGRVLAGANGDTTRQIFCAELLAELISISGEYWTMEQIPSKFIGKNVRICLKNGSLTIYSLN